MILSGATVLCTKRMCCPKIQELFPCISWADCSQSLIELMREGAGVSKNISEQRASVRDDIHEGSAEQLNGPLLVRSRAGLVH